MEPTRRRTLIGGYADEMPGPRRRWRPYFELDLVEKDNLGSELDKAKCELNRLKSLRPIPLIRTAKRLEKKERALKARLAKLQERINLLNGEGAGSRNHV
jgi:hypothetical protein